MLHPYSCKAMENAGPNRDTGVFPVQVELHGKTPASVHDSFSEAYLVPPPGTLV
jgi:hypothetical protein